MALDTSLKMGLVDISILHLLRKKKQSPERTAQKIIETCNTIFSSLPTEPQEIDQLISYVSNQNMTGVRNWIISHYSCASAIPR